MDALECHKQLSQISSQLEELRELQANLTAEKIRLEEDYLAQWYSEWQMEVVGKINPVLRAFREMEKGLLHKKARAESELTKLKEERGGGE